MIKKDPWPVFLALLLALFACHPEEEARLIRIYPDSLISEVSNHPVGINLDFFMDGGRFPDAERSTAEAVKEMGMSYLRYPGGEKSDLYLFSKPPYETAHPAVARSGGLEDYPGMITGEYDFAYDPLDFDEYIDLCKKVDAEPVVVVAADYYLIPLKEGEWVTPREELIRHAVEWVRYANIKKKYGVKYWMIGNESWNANNVNSTADIYAQDVIDFSKAMKEADPSIWIIANGQGDAFFKTVITEAGDYIDRLTVSNYGVQDFHRGYSTYRDTAQLLIRPALTAIGAMNACSSPDQMKRFKMIVAEYGPIDWAGLWHGNNDMGHAIVTFDMTGQLLLQSQIEFSCFWNTRWIENETRPGVDHDALDKDGHFNPTGRALSIWGNFLGTRMIRADGTQKVLAYASTDPRSGTLYVYLINKGKSHEHVLLDIKNQISGPILDAREFFGTSPQDLHPVWQQAKRIKPGKPVNLKGTSITILKIRLGQKTNYYFDPVRGNDSIHSGTTPEDPFRSLSMIGSIHPGAGDSLLLRSGAIFTDRLYLSCKGEPGMPVVLGKYGGEARPHIQAGGRFRDGVHLFNSEHVVIRDLEISNRGEIPVDGISGILVELKDYGTAKDITLDNLLIHDVFGVLVRENLGGGSAVRISSFEDEDTLSRPSRFDGLTVQNCTIKDCQRNGITMWGNWIRSKWYPSLHVVIRNNLLDGVPGDGIVPVACDGPLVEYNVMRNCPAILPPSEACDGIWPWSCDHAVVQFNVVSGHRSQVDGYAYDSDWNSTHSLFQYNLSFNNDGGFLLICNSGGWPPDWSIGNRGTRVRYNVSINDGLRDYVVAGNDSCFSPVIHITGPAFNTVLEKNLFYLPPKENPETDRTLCALTDWRGYPDSTAFLNNYIFVAERTRAVRTDRSTRNVYRDNYYSGDLQHPGEGFIPCNGAFNSEMWYDPKDAGWNTLVEFIKDQKVLLGGKEVKVPELLGCGSYSCHPVSGAESLDLLSPGRQLVFSFDLQDGYPSYSVAYKGMQLVRPSRLALDLEGTGELGGDLVVSGIKRERIDESYGLVVGKTKSARDHCNELTIHLKERRAPSRRFDLVVRAYDEGIAFRYEFPVQETGDYLTLTGEHSTFRPAGDPQVLALFLPDYTTSHEGLYTDVAFAEMREDSLMDLPAVFDFKGVYMAITEAALHDYAGMYLVRHGGILESRLSPLPGQEKIKVKAKLPHNSPWRVMLISDRFGDLLESNILTSLNEPCRITDTSWLRPGKATWPWWNGTVVGDPAIVKGNNFETNKYYIDFCARNGIEYHSVVECDGHEWYVNDGQGYMPGPGADVTKPVEGLDMQEICDYARSKGVGIRLWVHWAALWPKLEEAFSLYEKWGISGLMIDFMDRDDQEMVRLQEEMLERAAAHRLHVQFHGAYKPTVMHRTWPNEFTREGTLNYEVDKWDSTITPDHDLDIVFTRLLAGPTDYHLGGFRAVNRKNPADNEMEISN